MKKFLLDLPQHSRFAVRPPETPPHPNPAETPPQQPPESIPTTPEEIPLTDPPPAPGDATPRAAHDYLRLVVIYGRPRRWILRRHNPQRPSP